jgi:hypothetical protein
MARATKIYGRVVRNLKRYDLRENDDFVPDEVYDEMTEVQNMIISEISPTKKITITMEEDVETYGLSTDTSALITTKRKNIGGIKIVKLPTDWMYGFDVVPNKEFFEKVNANPTTTINQPVVGTVIDYQLQVYPAPSSEVDGDELEFIVYENFAAQDIGESTEPELPQMFDKCLEQGATAQFLSGNEREQCLNNYNMELGRLRPLIHRTNFNLQSPNVWDTTKRIIRDDYDN